MIQYSTRRIPSNENEFGTWEATTPYRQIVWTGDTEEEAIAAMLKGMMQLSRCGSINPNEPTIPGSARIAHSLEVLTEELGRLVGNRGYLTNEARQKAPNEELADLGKPDELLLARNRQIAAVSTAIAALARVDAL